MAVPMLRSWLIMVGFFIVRGRRGPFFPVPPPPIKYCFRGRLPLPPGARPLILPPLPSINSSIPQRPILLLVLRRPTGECLLQGPLVFPSLPLWLPMVSLSLVPLLVLQQPLL